MWFQKRLSHSAMSFSNSRKMEEVCRWRFSFWCFNYDLSKAFDCLDDEIIIAKLNSYAISWPVLKLIHDYFRIKSREQE